VILLPSALVKISVLSQVVNAGAAFVLIFHAVTNHKKELMEEAYQHRSFNVIAWGTTVIMIDELILLWNNLRGGADSSKAVNAETQSAQRDTRKNSHENELSLFCGTLQRWVRRWLPDAQRIFPPQILHECQIGFEEVQLGQFACVRPIGRRGKMRFSISPL